MSQRILSPAGFICSLLLLMSATLPALADDDLGVTMRMVTDNEELTESVVREIELNDPILLTPTENPARDARQKGREFGQSMSERGREIRELRGAGQSTAVPDAPGKPESSQGGPRPEVPDPGQR